MFAKNRGLESGRTRKSHMQDTNKVHMGIQFLYGKGCRQSKTPCHGKVFSGGKWMLFANNLNVHGSLAGAYLIPVNKIDITEIAQIKLAVAGDDGF